MSKIIVIAVSVDQISFVTHNNSMTKPKTISSWFLASASFFLAVVSDSNICAADHAVSEAVPLGDPQTLAAQPVKNDTGINVLLDLAHQMLFHTCWGLPPALRERGLRVVGSQAALNTVLNREGRVRVRLPSGSERPFAWIPSPQFNVVLTIQPDPNAQAYLPEEIEAAQQFVRDGGGLVMVGGSVPSEDQSRNWPLNALARAFGADISGQATALQGRTAAALKLDGRWQVHLAGDNNAPVVASREFGAGRVVVISNFDLITWDSKVPPDSPRSRTKVSEFLADLIRVAAEGKKPVGGTARLPMEAAGGGPIYPEKDLQVGDVLVMYAKNQKPELVKTVVEDMPKVKEQVLNWFPSSQGGTTMNLILSAGGGGGWAVNAYKPEEVGIISLDKEGILSVFAHELTHNLPGPPNDKGEQAGRLPGVFSEAHAGWYQGKIESLRTGDRGGHDPNRLFDFDQDGSGLDLANLKNGEMGRGWTKLWFIWQKLDERYGPTWYPRWMWVKNVRWQDDPNHRLTWDEVVEDMSIACGEDLFPFFRKLGTTLGKERLPEVVFQGKRIVLPPATLAVERAGPAQTEAIGDFRKSD